MEPLIEYIQRFHPAFPTTIQGASTAEIGYFEHEAGCPLPRAYREFLLRMGHSTGEFRVAWECSFRIEDLVEFYRELRKEEGKTPDADDVRMTIGVGGISIEEVYLDIRQGGQDDPPVRMIGNRDALLGASWTGLLHRVAFTKYELPSHRVVASYSSASASRIVESAAELAAQLGFSCAPFSDEIAYCGRHGDTSLIALQFEGEGAIVVIGGPDAKSVRSTGSVFSDKLQLEWAG